MKDNVNWLSVDPAPAPGLGGATAEESLMLGQKNSKPTSREEAGRALMLAEFQYWAPLASKGSPVLVPVMD
jgi:hypothetical protein